MASVYSVSQVNAYIKNMFLQDFALSRISVKGEVSNCKYHTSGHIYFTLKDGSSAISAVMFAGNRSGLSFQLKEGQRVVAAGSIDVYERDGRYQLYAKKITLDGEGDLFLRFQKLRDELEEMGMFAPEYKQPIPRYAKTVGIVTASTGAAIRDIMNIASRRNPYVQLVLCPALVQGEQAKYSIAKGIETLDAMGLDVIIVGRGGGSIEDLWAFNEEVVARAIAESRIPVISCVGHEVDFTIADFVADLRAPTPSAAAELAVPVLSELSASLDGARSRLAQALLRGQEVRWAEFRRLTASPAVSAPVRTLLEGRAARLAQASTRLGAAMERRMERDRHRLELAGGLLRSLNPENVVSRGYAIVERAGKILTHAADANPGEALDIRLPDGTIRATAEEVKVKEHGKEKADV